MLMYNLIEYSKNYSKTSESLWNCYRDEPNGVAQGNVNHYIKGSKSFDYKTSITGKLENNNAEKAKIAVPFCITLDIPLINLKYL